MATDSASGRRSVHRRRLQRELRGCRTAATRRSRVGCRGPTARRPGGRGTAGGGLLARPGPAPGPAPLPVGAPKRPLAQLRMASQNWRPRRWSPRRSAGPGRCWRPAGRCRRPPSQPAAAAPAVVTASSPWSSEAGVELAEAQLDPGAPAAAEPPAQVGDLDLLGLVAVAQVALGVQHLLGRDRRVAVGAVDRLPAALLVEGADEAQALLVGEQHRLADDRRGGVALGCGRWPRPGRRRPARPG